MQSLAPLLCIIKIVSILGKGMCLFLCSFYLVVVESPQEPMEKLGLLGALIKSVLSRHLVGCVVIP